MDSLISPKFDSVFSQEQQIPFADDTLPIALPPVIKALETIEQHALDALYSPLERETMRIVRQAEPLTKSGDIKAIASLDWNLTTVLQAPIVDVWQRGWQLGGRHSAAEIRASIPPEDRPRYALSSEEVEAIAAAMELKTAAIGSAVERVILRRSIKLASSFANDQLGRLKVDLIAATSPDSDGKVLSRKELLDKIQKNLGVGRARAGAIAQTELTAAYNQARVATALQSSLVTHFRFLAIMDGRTTPYCVSRNGMLVPVEDAGAIANNQPPLHVRCRSVLSPILGTINPTHAEWAADPKRDYSSIKLYPLPVGWRGAEA